MRAFKHTLDRHPVEAPLWLPGLGGFLLLALIIFVAGVQVGIRHGRDLERRDIAQEAGRE
jgi:hypothetical protein